MQANAQTPEQAVTSIKSTDQRSAAPSSIVSQGDIQHRVSRSDPLPQQDLSTSETTPVTVVQPESIHDITTASLLRVQTSLDSNDKSEVPFAPFSYTNGLDARGDETHAAATALDTFHSGPQGLEGDLVGEARIAPTAIMLIDCQLCDQRHEFAILCATMEDILLPQRWEESQQALE